MKRTYNDLRPLHYALWTLGLVFMQGCGQKEDTANKIVANGPMQDSIQAAGDPLTKPDYFLLRPDVEKAYGYSHAVKVGDIIKISGAVSMDADGVPTAVGDMEQQIKNCYTDLGTILAHYGCSFDDVIQENIFTTDMALFLENSAYRSEIYKNHFPTGTWAGVTELALPEFLVEIELEAYRPQ